MVTLINACKIWGEWRNLCRDVTIEEMDIVFNICARDRITVKQLILSGLSSRSTILRHLRGLVDRGIVAMQPPDNDRRVRELVLTRKGMRWATRLADRMLSFARTLQGH